MRIRTGDIVETFNGTRMKVQKIMGSKVWGTIIKLAIPAAGMVETRRVGDYDSLRKTAIKAVVEDAS